MSETLILILFDLLKAGIRFGGHILAESKMTPEQKEAHWQGLSDELPKYSPSNLTPPP